MADGSNPRRAQLLRPGAPPGGVRSLVDLSLDALAAHSEYIYTLHGIDEDLTVALLYRIIQRNKLNVRLAHVFMASGHDELAEAMGKLDLYGAIPSHMSIPGRGHF
jgi:hypothetical protein